MASRSVVFLTRPGCGLCDSALPRVRWAATMLRSRLTVVDIQEDPGLEAEYHLRIPVLLDASGDVVAEGPIGIWDAIRGTFRAKG